MGQESPICSNLVMIAGVVLLLPSPASAAVGGAAVVGAPDGTVVGKTVIFVVNVQNTGTGSSENFDAVSFANNGSVGLDTLVFPVSQAIPAGGNASFSVTARIIAAPGTQADLNLSVTGVTAGAATPDPTFNADGTPFEATTAVSATLSRDKAVVTGSDTITYTLVFTNASDTAAQLTGQANFTAPAGATEGTPVKVTTTSVAGNATAVWSLTVNVNDSAIDGDVIIQDPGSIQYAMSAISLPAGEVPITPSSVASTVRAPTGAATVGAPDGTVVGKTVIFVVNVQNTGTGSSENFDAVSFANNGSVGLDTLVFPVSQAIPAGGNASFSVTARIIAAPGTQADLNLSVTGVTAGAATPDPTFNADGTPFEATTAVSATLSRDKAVVTGSDTITYTLVFTNASDTAAQLTGQANFTAPAGATEGTPVKVTTTSVAGNATAVWSLTVNVNDSAIDGDVIIQDPGSIQYAMSAISLPAGEVPITPSSVASTVRAPTGAATVGAPDGTVVGKTVIFVVNVQNTGTGSSENFDAVSFANNGSVGLDTLVFPVSQAIPAGGNASFSVTARIIAAPGTQADLNLSVTGVTAGAATPDPTFNADGTPFEATTAVSATLSRDKAVVTGSDTITYTLVFTNASDTAAQLTGQANFTAPAGATEGTPVKVTTTSVAGNATAVWSLTVNVNDSAIDGDVIIQDPGSIQYAMSAISLPAGEVPITPSSVASTVRAPTGAATVGAPDGTVVGKTVIFVVNVQNTGTGSSENFDAVSFANNGSVGLDTLVF